LTAAAALATRLEQRTRKRSSHSTVDTAVFCGLFALLLFAPLAFGATEPWSICCLELGAATLTLIWFTSNLLSPKLRIKNSSLFMPMLAFAALVFAQLIAGITAYRYRTFSAALLYCAYGMLVFLTVQVLRRKWQIKILAVTFGTYGFLLASFALVQSMTSDGKIYWFRTVSSYAGIYGPYANHNHYAGLVEMLLPVPLVVAFSRRISAWRRALAAFAAVVMGSTIFLCGSRGGMIALLWQIVLLAGLLLWQKKIAKAFPLLLMFLAAVIIFSTWLGGNEIADRIASIHSEAHTELSGGTRLSVARDSYHMFTLRPVAGWGLATFRDVYPQFRTFYSNFAVDYAHDDYLQLLVETGVLGGLVTLWFLVIVFRNSLRKIKNNSDTDGAVALAALLGITGILIHSFFDFNLQIPANAAIFYVLCGVAALEPRFGRGRAHRASASALDDTST
jgi:O-antigen ligase